MNLAKNQRKIVKLQDREVDSYDGKGPIRVNWEFREKVIPEECRQLFLPLYLRDPATLRLRTGGIHMCGISDVTSDFLIDRTAGYHFVLFTEKGEGKLTAGKRTFCLVPGSLALVPAETAHRYHPYPGSGNWKFLWFHLLPIEPWGFLTHEGAVSGESTTFSFLQNVVNGFISEIHPLHSVMASDNLAPFFYLDSPELEHSMSDFNLKSAAGENASDEGLAFNYAELILGYLRRELKGLFHHSAEYDGKRRLETLWREISRNPAADWSLEKLALQLNMSVSTFLRLTRRIYDTTPSGIIHQIRLREAARLLAETDQPVFLIAEQAGYGSMSSFAAAFRTHFHCSPREYRTRSRTP